MLIRPDCLSISKDLTERQQVVSFWVSCFHPWLKGFESCALALLPNTWGFELIVHTCADVSHRQDVSTAAHTALKCTKIQSCPDRLSFPLDGRCRQTV